MRINLIGWHLPSGLNTNVVDAAFSASKPVSAPLAGGVFYRQTKAARGRAQRHSTASRLAMAFVAKQIQRERGQA